MPSNSDRRLNFNEHIVLPIGGCFFIMQILFFAYNFNFQGLPFFVFAGWILLLPGFLLISISQSSLETNGSRNVFLEELKDYILRLTSHPLLDGWLLMSLALALISQHWLCVFCMCVQIPLIVIGIYNK